MALDLSRTPGLQQTTQSGILGSSSMPLVARVYRKLGTWQWALSPGLDDDTIQGNEQGSFSHIHAFGVCLTESAY